MLAAALAVVCVAQGTGAVIELLPDLVQERPSDITVTYVAGRDRLGFRSAVHNSGTGPLIVLGRRADRGVPDMEAFQIIRRADGTSRRVLRPVGILRYVTSQDHAHWHYRPFERYELRTASGRTVGRDSKSGFCLGDRYRAAGVRGAGRPVYIGACGLHKPAMLQVRQGISVGWGDDYGAFLEGQSIDVTGLPSGTYRLTHTVNASGRLRERTRANNSASVRIALYRLNGMLRVRVLAR